MVPTIKKAVLTLLLATGVCSSVGAQQDHHSEITIGHRGISALKADLKFLLDQTPPVEQKQYANIVDIMDLIFYGVDEERPMRVDILTGTTPPTSVVWGPYIDLEQLQDENIGSNYQLKKEADNLYKLLDDEQPGWFRALSKLKYAVIILAQDRNDLPLMKQIIQRLNDPMPALKQLLLNGANVGISLTNKAVEADDQKKRRDSFAEIRANKLSTLQKRPSETATAFELRKGLVTNELTELERLMVEAKRASARIFLDKINGSARVEFASEAIAETSFADSLQLFGKKVDAFDSIAKSEGSVLSIRGNHPVDELRKNNLISIVELSRKDTAALLEANSKMTAQEKEASQKLFDGIAAVTIDGINSGNLNGFLETTVDDSGEFSSVGAISVVDGNRLTDTLALIAETGNGNKVAVDFAEAGGVKIHEIRMAEGFFKPFDDLFGVGKPVYVGITEDICWMGTGKESLETLKTAIADLKSPEMNDTILKIEGNVLPWAKRALDLVKKTNPSEIAEQEKRRDRMRSLELAVQSLSTKDDARFELRVKDGKGTGEIFVNLGILKYIGREVSFYSKTTLDE